MNCAVTLEVDLEAGDGFQEDLSDVQEMDAKGVN